MTTFTKASTFLLLLSGSALQPTTQFKPRPMGNLKQIMRSINLPNSNVIFKVQTKAPQTDEEWNDVQDAAVALSESANNLIVVPGRLREDGKAVPVQNPDWTKFSQGLSGAAEQCLTAARSRSQNAVSRCTDDLSDACSNCHDVYRDRQQK